MKMISKNNLLKKVILLLFENLKKTEESLIEMNNDINDAPGAMQSHSDTTRFQLTKVVDGIEKSFLKKSKEFKILKEFAKSNIDKISINNVKIGSLLVIKKNDNLIENYFIIPAGSGLRFKYENKNIICITPFSPLGKILLGKIKNDTLKFSIGDKLNKLDIIEIF